MLVRVRILPAKLKNRAESTHQRIEYGKSYRAIVVRFGSDTGNGAYGRFSGDAGFGRRGDSGGDLEAVTSSFSISQATVTVTITVSKTVSNNKPVTASGYGLSGPDSGNYTHPPTDRSIKNRA